MSGCDNRKHLTDGSEQRPPGVYVAQFLPCEHRRCRGALFCIGHALCRECGAMVRSRRGVWKKTGEPAEVVLIASV